MSESYLNEIEKRLSKLEEKMIRDSPTPLTTTTKEKKPRKSSDYNIFMKEYIAQQKSSGVNKSPKELIAEGAKAWNIKKNSN
jgi:hypothetical protein